MAIFQPHRYSRTHTFLQEFAQAFKDADLVVITDIYSAGEQNTFGISGSDLVKAIATYHHDVHYYPEVNSIENFLHSEILQSGDLAIFLGAGNLNQSIPKTIALFSMNNEQ